MPEGREATPLLCPHCGAAIYVYCDDREITCDGDNDCGATWDIEGKPVNPSRLTSRPRETTASDRSEESDA